VKEKIMSLQQAIAEFRSQFQGPIIEPGDAIYEQERKVFNGMIDRKPKLVVKCTDAADVIAAVRMAKRSDLQSPYEGVGTMPRGWVFATTV